MTLAVKVVFRSTDSTVNVKIIFKSKRLSPWIFVFHRISSIFSSADSYHISKNIPEQIRYLIGFCLFVLLRRINSILFI